MADVHGRLTGRAAVAMATLGPGRHEPRDRHRRRLPRPRADGRDHRPGRLGQAPQGSPPVRRHRPACSSRSRSGTRASSGSTAIPEIVRKAFRVADAGEARARPTSSCPRTSPRRRSSPATRPGRSTPGRTYFPEPTDEAIAHAARLIADVGAADHPGRQRRPAAERGAGELRALARGLHVPVAATFMGKGAIDDRSHLSLMAVGLQARDHVLSGFDRADLVDLRRLRPRRVRAVALEPGRTQADHPHRHPAGRGRRRLPARGRAHRRHRRARCAGCSPPSCRAGIGGRDAERAPRGRARSSSTPTCARQLLAELDAYERDDGWPIKPQKAIADLRRGARPDGHRGQRRRRPQGLGRAAVPGLRAEHRDHLERLRGDGHLAARARSRPSSSTRTARSSRCAATAAS